MKKYLMAIDAGTGSVRAVLFDVEGNQIGCSQHEWTHNEDPRFPGSMDFDWTFNWKLASSCVRNVLAETGIDPADIAAISTTCMREGILLYDQDGNEIWACANVDARSTDEVAELIRMDPDLELALYQKSGQSYALNAIPRILWVKNNLPEIYEKAAKVGMFNDWLIYKLTGVLAVEPSNGSTTGLLDLQTRTWIPTSPQSVICALTSSRTFWNADRLQVQSPQRALPKPGSQRGHRSSSAVVTVSSAPSVSAHASRVKPRYSVAASGSMNLIPTAERPIHTDASV